jgi:hypothetical protein
MGRPLNWARARRRAVQSVREEPRSVYDWITDEIIATAATMGQRPPLPAAKPNQRRLVLITTGPLQNGCLALHEFPSPAAARAGGFTWIRD